MAEHRAPKIADREGEYRARMRQRIISPPRYDPFADGGCISIHFYIDNVRAIKHLHKITHELHHAHYGKFWLYKLKTMASCEIYQKYKFYRNKSFKMN